MSGNIPKRGRVALSPTTRARRRKEIAQRVSASRINIGRTFNDWVAIKEQKGFTKHEEVAAYLINTLRKYEAMQQEVVVKAEQSICETPEASEDVPGRESTQDAFKRNLDLLGGGPTVIESWIFK